MYTTHPWTIRQYAGYGSAAESNERYRKLLDEGSTGLSVAFDLPTQMGMDSDAELAHGEVGKVGVAIDSIDDMRTLLAEESLAGQWGTAARRRYESLFSGPALGRAYSALFQEIAG